MRVKGFGLTKCALRKEEMLMLLAQCSHLVRDYFQDSVYVCECGKRVVLYIPSGRKREDSCSSFWKAGGVFSLPTKHTQPWASIPTQEADSGGDLNEISTCCQIYIEFHCLVRAMAEATMFGGYRKLSFVQRYRHQISVFKKSIPLVCICWPLLVLLVFALAVASIMYV